MTDENDAQPGGGSIDTVLTSIRRMLQEGKEAHAAAQAASASEEAKAPEAVAEPVTHEPPPPAEDEDDVLVLDASMQAPEEEAPILPPAVPEPADEGADVSDEPVTEAIPEPDSAEAPLSEAAQPEPPVSEQPVVHAEPQVSHEQPPVIQAPAPESVAQPAPEPASDETPAPKAPPAEPAVVEQPAVHADSQDVHEPAPTVPAVQIPVSEPDALPAPVEAAQPKQADEAGSIPTQLARIRMSDTNNAAETPGYSAASDADAPAPVQIALDKQTVGATEHSFGALQQMLRRKQSNEHKERRVAITRGGNLTIEDIVRDEVRAFLKEWLDQHLSGIVQQAVQKEIERLSDR